MNGDATYTRTEDGYRPTRDDVRAVITTDLEQGVRVTRAIGTENPVFREATRSHFVSYSRYGG